MEGYLFILGKGIVSIIVLFLLTKLMGRKQVGQMNLFDYVIGITIGSIAAEMTLNEKIDFFEGVFSLIIYAVIALLISILTMKSIKARRFFIGSPLILIQNGEIIMKNMKVAKLDINDLLQEARVNGHFDLSQVEYALMEGNGKISFLLKSKYQPATLKDLKIKTAYQGLCANLVIDGKVMTNNLKALGKEEKWLRTRLKNEGYEDLADLLLVIMDSNEKLTIFKKNKDKESLQILE